MSNLNKLTEIGFEKVGEWEIEIGKQDRIKYNIESEHLQKTEVLYCFISEEQPYYFGITDKTLKERMNNYKAGKANGTSGSTNKKVHKKVLEFLKDNKTVEIYVLSPNEELEYKGYPVSIHKGIEHSLIQSFECIEGWNERGVK